MSKLVKRYPCFHYGLFFCGDKTKCGLNHHFLILMFVCKEIEDEYTAAQITTMVWYSPEYSAKCKHLETVVV